MNNPEAKFILRAYRPDGRDAQDPTFREALAQAELDPALGAWFRREQAVDEALSSRIGALQVPDLRATILAGGRAGRQRRAWWRRSVWFAAAAALAVLIGVAVRLRVRPTAPEAYALAHFALQDVALDGKSHLGPVAGLEAVQRELADPRTHLAAGVAVDLADLRRGGCRTVQVAGHEVCEICFARDGEFHLYIARRGDFDASAETKEPMFVEQGRLASATWTDARYVYVAVTGAGPDALRRAL
jgi:hypothetical protein